MKKLFFTLFVIISFAACVDNTDFSINPQKCKSLTISDTAQKSLTLIFTDKWYVKTDNGNFPADTSKLTALFNTLRDMLPVGSAPESFKKAFSIRVSAFDNNNNLIKTLDLGAVASTSDLIICRDSDKPYVASVPGLDINPIQNFSVNPSYWFYSVLSDIPFSHISFLSVENFENHEASFKIILQDNKFIITDFEDKLLEVDKQSIANYLCAYGIFSAAEITDNIVDTEKFYQLKATFTSGRILDITFYKKYNNNSPDYNLMWFRSGSLCGTVKYFDVDLLLNPTF